MDIEQKSNNQAKYLNLEENRELAKYVDYLQIQSFTREDLKECKDLLNTQDAKNILKAVIMIRKILTNENPCIQEVLDYGLVPKLMELLKDKQQNAHTHYESLWALSNICSGTNEQIRHCINADIIPITHTFLQHPNKEIQDQTIWIVGNIACDSNEFRTMILKEGILGKILKMLQSSLKEKKEILERIIWSLRNICKIEYLPSLEQAVELITVFTDILKSEVKSEPIKIDILYSLSYLSYGNNTQREAIFKCDITNQLVRYIGGNNIYLIMPSQRIIGNLFTGTEEQILHILNTPNCLKNMIALLNSKSSEIRKEALWVMSNLAADTIFGYKLYENEYAIKRIVEMALNEQVIVSIEAYFALANAADQANMAQLQILFDLGLLKVFYTGLCSSNNTSVIVCLEGIQATLVEKLYDPFIELSQQSIIDKFEQYGYLEKLEKLLEHEDHQVVDRSGQILATLIPGYDLGDDDDNDDNNDSDDDDDSDE